MKSGLLLAALIGLTMAGSWSGCKPRTAGQKIEDKTEDAGHEVKQGVERAKENAQ